MTDLAIRAEGLGKRYRIGARSAATDALPRRLKALGRAPLATLRSALGRSADDPLVWALRDVSFAIPRGEVVGIVGHNGAGKSTLLKILSRVTEPTTGEAEIRGRVGSLLEVGTGFHPDLTGRENLFLNGAILGMSRREVQRNFDEIVAFAEVERFIDTPVKRYSSGMYLRLAFAVAAHLEAEILIVDEVLAVGDANFQKKCLGKMDEVGHQGRTVLFVSHNLPAVTRLCPRSLLLVRGQLAAEGPSHEVVRAYLTSGLGTTAARRWGESGVPPGDDIVRLLGVRVRTEAGQTVAAIDIRQPVGIEMEFEVNDAGHRLVPGFQVRNSEGVVLFCVLDHDPAWRRRARPEGRYVTTAWIPGNYLAEGTLLVDAAISTMETVTIHVWERDVVAFEAIDSQEGDSARGDYAGPMPGIVRPLLQWTTQYAPPYPGNRSRAAELARL